MSDGRYRASHDVKPDSGSAVTPPEVALARPPEATEELKRLFDDR